MSLRMDVWQRQPAWTVVGAGFRATTEDEVSRWLRGLR